MSSDARGNLTNDGTRAYSYDSANRMTGTGSSTLAYDPLDRLVEMTGTAGGVYLYDGDMITAVKVPAAPTINNRLVRGPWPDELLVAYQGNTAATPLWSLQDHQASTIAITDAAGAAPYTLAYDEYGQPRSGNAGRIMFTGQLWLPDFGLYHYKARAYHPGLGRFMQTDPVGYAQGMNLYAYVANDPVNRTDPTGMIHECQGSSTLCSGIDAGLAATDRAIANLAGDPRQANLQGIRSSIGTAGDGNNVLIKGVTSGPLASAIASNGQITISVNEGLFTSSGLQSQDVGEVLIHEQTHGLDQLQTGGIPRTYDAALAGEVRAYTNQSDLVSGFGTPSRWGFVPGDTAVNQGAISSNAIQSTTEYCGQSPSPCAP